MALPCRVCIRGEPSTCTHPNCPLRPKYVSFHKVKPLLKDNFFGSAPAPFVGHYGYPKVNVGILSPPEQRNDAWLHDAPQHWSQQQFHVPKIVELRSSLINSKFISDIKAHSSFLSMAQEVGLASKPVDVEIGLEKVPTFRLHLDQWSAPTGPQANVKKIRVTENPSIPQAVEKVFGESDLKAGDALQYLSKKGFDENYLMRMFSVGTMGVKTQRRLVPTRWAITAVDDTLGKQIITQLEDFSSTDFEARFGGYLGNNYLIIFFPDAWSYELFEMHQPYSGQELKYSTDDENCFGRKTYAQNTEGGYYACRLGVLEHLRERKRKAAVLVIRVITDDYAVPLGVWVVREATRKAMLAPPITFASKELMLIYAEQLIKKKFGFSIAGILTSSNLLKAIKKQRKLWEYGSTI